MRPALIICVLFLISCTGIDDTTTLLASPTSQPNENLVATAVAAAPSPSATTCAAPSASPLRFLALGDSYTIGQSVAAAESWPHQLAMRLRDRGISVLTPEIVARTGWTTADLLTGIVEAEPQAPYDLVSLQIGVNNQYQNLPFDQYRDDFLQLLQQAIVFAGGDAGRVLVVSTPDYGVTPFANRLNQAVIAADIDALNVVAQETAVAFSARFIDITPISRQAGSTPQLIADDRLHPSPLMYNLWVEEMLPVVCSALGQ